MNNNDLYSLNGTDLVYLTKSEQLKCEEVELFNFIVEIDSTCARGVLVELHEQLYKRLRES